MPRTQLTTAVLVALLALGSAHPTSTWSIPDKGPIVWLDGKKIVGTTTRSALHPTAEANQYLGIPFAKPTLGSLRFMPPQDPEPWMGLVADQFKPSCVRQFPDESFRSIFNNLPLPESEDCLYLNVFTPPSPPPAEGRPVMFWIHRGSFQLGSARLPDYDGSSMAVSQDVVVVTTNYRLNVFGFPGSLDLPLEERNLGLLDQRKALNWAHNNVAAFGGDPKKITLVGESSGGYSVRQLVALPPDPLPFRAAVFQSQAFGPNTDNVENWKLLSEQLGCDKPRNGLSQLQCVQSAPANQIRSIIDTQLLSFSPIIDNRTLSSTFADAVEQGTAAKVPILIGTNANEGTVLAPVMPSSEILMTSFVGNDSKALSAAFGSYPQNLTSAQLKASIVTDYTYTCISSEIAHTLENAGYDVWRYYLEAVFENNQPFPGADAWHTSEIPLVFGTIPGDSTALQKRLSETMQRAWMDFVKEPSLGPGWSRVGEGNRDLQVFSSNPDEYSSSRSEESVDGICKLYNPAIRAEGY